MTKTTRWRRNGIIESYIHVHNKTIIEYLNIYWNRKIQRIPVMALFSIFPAIVLFLLNSNGNMGVKLEWWPTPTLDQMYQLSIQLEKYSIYFTNLILDKLLKFIHLRSNFHFGVGVGVGVNDSNHPKCMRRSTVGKFSSRMHQQDSKSNKS